MIPQLMPLFWMISGVSLIIMLMVMILLYSLSYLNIIGNPSSLSLINIQWYW